MVSAVFAPVCPCHPGRRDEGRLCAALTSTRLPAAEGRDPLAAARLPQTATYQDPGGRKKGKKGRRGESGYGSRPKQKKKDQEVTLILPQGLKNFSTSEDQPAGDKVNNFHSNKVEIIKPVNNNNTHKDSYRASMFYLFISFSKLYGKNKQTNK